MAKTRFRAYQLGEAGSSFSYCYDGHFALIEAGLNERNTINVFNELKEYSNRELNTLHITSWD